MSIANISTRLERLSKKLEHLSAATTVCVALIEKRNPSSSAAAIRSMRAIQAAVSKGQVAIALETRRIYEEEHQRHVEYGQRRLEKVGLAGVDWEAAKYLTHHIKPCAIRAYPGGECWFVTCHDRDGKWMYEERLSFPSEKKIRQFAKHLGIPCTFDK